MVARENFLAQGNGAPTIESCKHHAPFENKRLLSVGSLECSLLIGTLEYCEGGVL